MIHDTCVFLSPSLADLMAAQGAETIVAIDVESSYINDWTNYGDDISGFSLLLNRLNPFAKKKRVSVLPEYKCLCACAYAHSSILAVSFF